MLIIQNSTAPGNIRHAIVDLVGQNTTELRVASAYVTRSGSNILLDAVANSLGGEAFAAIPKLLITSFDFGFTEPQALRDWLDLDNASVLVAGTQRLEHGSLIPSRAFHPKMYAFGKNDDTFNLLIGSANLTGRGLSVNSEVAWTQQSVASGEVVSAFTRTGHETMALSNELLATYEATRQQRPQPGAVGPEAEPVEPPAPIIDGDLPLFRTVIETGAVNPGDHNAMWIQGEGLQGGSQNQLELPRGGHTFFGFHFNQYDYPHNLTIGHPPLRSAARVWNDRPLTWHGNNRMERLNLPTIAQGGFNYADSAVMFRRLPDGSFELIVTPWESDLARSWRQASAQSELLFRLGTIATNRIVGLI
ncbi:MAG: phospholipase D family protein [Gammaproteobacteria bacterium]|nr:phospholipase D family protein [Gammaproteobacteria bacterium]